MFSAQHKGIFYAALSGMLYGFLGYLGTNILIYGSSSILNMLFWRFFIASVGLLLFLILPRKKLSFRFKEAASACLAGGLFYVGGAAFYFVGSKYIGTGFAMVLFYVAPALVALLNWLFYHQRLNKYYYISFLCILMGVFFLVDMSNLVFDVYGILFSILAALSYAFYIVFSKSQIKDLSPLFSSFMISVGCSMIFFILAVWHGEFFIPLNSIVWLNILAIGVISTALPIYFLLIGLKYINSTKAAIVSILEPVVTVIIGVILLDESMTWTQLIGIIVILLGAITIQFDRDIKRV